MLIEHKRLTDRNVLRFVERDRVRGAIERRRNERAAIAISGRQRSIRQLPNPIAIAERYFSAARILRELMLGHRYGVEFGIFSDHIVRLRVGRLREERKAVTLTERARRDALVSANDPPFLVEHIAGNELQLLTQHVANRYVAQEA